MDYIEFTKLENMQLPERNLISNLIMSDMSDRTLIYGYTCDRDTFHIYLKDGEVFGCMYAHHTISKDVNALPIRTLNDCIPNKRVYPHACDLEFCKILQQHGVNIPFTTFSVQSLLKHEDSGELYWGKVL